MRNNKINLKQYLSIVLLLCTYKIYILLFQGVVTLISAKLRNWQYYSPLTPTAVCTWLTFEIQFLNHFQCSSFCPVPQCISYNCPWGTWMVINDVISTGCVHLSTVVLLLELMLLGVWDVKVWENSVHVLLNAVKDSSEIINCQCGLCMTGESVCVCVCVCVCGGGRAQMWSVWVSV